VVSQFPTLTASPSVPCLSGVGYLELSFGTIRLAVQRQADVRRRDRQSLG